MIVYIIIIAAFQTHYNINNPYIHISDFWGDKEQALTGKLHGAGRGKAKNIWGGTDMLQQGKS